MKYLFTILAAWFLCFGACLKENNVQEVPEAQKVSQPISTPQNHLDRTFDSLSNELCCRVYFSEQQLNKLKKKRWPNSERLTIEPIRAIDPVYCNSKSNNPPE